MRLSREQLHLIAKLTFTGMVLFLVGLWRFSPQPVLNWALTAALLFSAPWLAHRLAPRLTGGLVEAGCARLACGV